MTDRKALSPRLDLRRLRYFVTVAEELHFGHAADRLQIAQPALSQQIRKLEQELGVELFLRARGKPVVLSEAGAVLLEEGRRVIQRATDAALAAQRAGRGEIGRVRVGFAPSSAASIMPLSVRMFRQRNPEVHLELEEMLSDDLATGLRAGDVDIGIARAPVDTSRLVLEVIAKEQLFVALPSAHRLARRSRVTVHALANEPLIASSRVGASGWHRIVQALYQRHGLIPTVAHEVSTIQAQLGLVAAELGIALVASSVAERDVAGITMVRVDAPLLELLVVRRDERSPATLEKFIECAREAGHEWSQTSRFRT